MKFTVSTNDVLFNVLKEKGLQQTSVTVPDVGTVNIVEFDVELDDIVKYKQCFVARQIGLKSAEEGVNSTRFKTLGE